MVYEDITGKVAIITDVNDEGLNKVVKKCEEISAKHNQPKPFVFIGDIIQDLIRQNFVDETVQKFGQIDILVNNAGILLPSSIFALSMESADKLFNILLRLPYDMCRLTVNQLIKTKGRVVNVSSAAGHAVCTQDPAYNTAKAGILHMTKCFADELGPYNVRVNSISPGPINTNITKSAPKTAEGENMLEGLGKRVCALKRWGQPEEVAKVIAFLVSDESGYITGSDIAVDGGMIAKHRAEL